jgi:hypothetical protein
MPWASIENRVSGPSAHEGKSHRFSLIGNLVKLCRGTRLNRTVHQGSANNGGVLGSWVKVSDDHDIRARGGNASHVRTFGGVPVTVGAKNHD